MELIVESDGNSRCIYSEDFPFQHLGLVSINRASSVEPEDGIQWTADLQQVGGPRLGPFASRKMAIDAEVQWLEQNWL